MKRSELIRRLRESAKSQGLGFELKRQGAQHEIWSFGDQSVQVPRHREISERLARAILKSVDAGSGPAARTQEK